MSLSLSSVFFEFCKYLDGKLKWTNEKDKTWTDTVFGFFTSLKPQYCSVETEHMRVDYLWRNNNTGDILLAVEHENAVSKIQRLLSEELQHLVDLKAIQKIAIVYPSLGDVERLMVGFGRKLQSRQYHLAIGILPAEEYLIIVGHTTRSDGRPAMEWKAHRFHATGAKEPTEDHVIFQKP